MFKRVAKATNLYIFKNKYVRVYVCIYTCVCLGSRNSPISFHNSLHTYVYHIIALYIYTA